ARREHGGPTTMSTKTVRRPKKRAVKEWRRIWHFYEDDSQVSICGTARRKPGEDHYEPECCVRGHTICGSAASSPRLWVLANEHRTCSAVAGDGMGSASASPGRPSDSCSSAWIAPSLTLFSGTVIS